MAWQCPRCGAPVSRLTDSQWWCGADGAVVALGEVEETSVFALLHHLDAIGFPTWLPWPLPAQWALAGVARAGDREVQATVSACATPHPLGGVADVLIVCEEPGVGLGARFADAPALDVGREISGSPATTRVSVDGHSTPLWWVPIDTDRDVFVGEASGRWLWLVTWPASAGVLVGEVEALVDLRDLAGQLELIPLTTRSQRLPG